MFADPQSITDNTVSKSLPCIGRGDSQSEYRTVDSGGVTYDLILSRTFAKRTRAVARLKVDSAVTDPLVPANSVAVSTTVSFSIDRPQFGVTADRANQIAQALVDWLTDANILKLCNGET